MGMNLDEKPQGLQMLDLGSIPVISGLQNVAQRLILHDGIVENTTLQTP